MGEAASTAVLTVEDIGEKFPESRSELKFLVPLQDSTIKIGDKYRFSVQGKSGAHIKRITVSGDIFCHDLVNKRKIVLPQLKIDKHSETANILGAIVRLFQHPPIETLRI